MNDRSNCAIPRYICHISERLRGELLIIKRCTNRHFILYTTLLLLCGERTTLIVVVFFPRRLSEQARRQLEKTNTKFEDLSLGDRRPTQLIRRYGNLYTEGRLDALDALDDVTEMTEFTDLKGKLLLTILVVSFPWRNAFLANVNFRYLLSPIRLSVCLSSVCNAAPYSGGSNFRQYFCGIR